MSTPGCDGWPTAISTPSCWPRPASIASAGPSAVIRERLSLDQFLPAPGQGALALQTRIGEAGAAWVAALDHPLTALAVAAERGAMTALEGSCRSAIGAHATRADGRLRLTAELLSPDGTARWRRSGDLGDITADDVVTAAHTMGLAVGRQIHDAAGDQRIDL